MKSLEMSWRRLVGLAALFGALVACPAVDAAILIPMDDEQTDHLRAYGLVLWVLQEGGEVDWLLGYRGGSFLICQTQDLDEWAEDQAAVMIDLDEESVSTISKEITDSETMAIVSLTHSARVAFYMPPTTPISNPLVPLLEYSGITYSAVWDEDVLSRRLGDFDILMVPHEDFTGQFGRFHASFRDADWYRTNVEAHEAEARRLGFEKVGELKRAVVRSIRDWVARGGILFGMCSGTDTFDIALATKGLDIWAAEFDGDGRTPEFNEKLDYTSTLAFKDFTLVQNPYIYEFSDIDMTPVAYKRGEKSDYFTLHEFSAKEQPLLAMLVQCHRNVVKGFMGQTTSFNKALLKDNIVILAEPEAGPDARYIYGTFGNGHFIWLGGHDPEDWQHRVGDPPTDPELHKNSPAYRLILNCILAPSAFLSLLDGAK